MSGKGLEQVPHITHFQPPVDHHHLSDGIHGPVKHNGQTKATNDAGSTVTSRGQTGGSGGGGTKPTGGSGGQTEGGGGTTEGGGAGPKSSRPFAPTAQRHNFHEGSYQPEQTVITIPSKPASQSTVRPTTTESTRTTTTQTVDSTLHFHSHLLQSSLSEHHDVKGVAKEKEKHTSHEVPSIHHHHHHLIHHHLVHRHLTHPHHGEHRHPAYHTHHPVHHPIHHVIKHHVDKEAHPHKEITKDKTEPGHIVNQVKKERAAVVVANDSKTATTLEQDQSLTVHKETTIQKVDEKTVVTDSTKVVNTPATGATQIPGPVKEHFKPSNGVQLETHTQGTQSVTVSRTITPSDNLSVRVDLDHAKFGTLSVVDDHALFPTTSKDGQPANSNLYLQGGAFIGGKKTTSEGLLPFDQKSGIILGLNGFHGLGHDRSLYGGINYSTGEGFADGGLQQSFRSGYVYGGLQYSVAKGFNPSKSFEFGGSLNLGHGKNSPSLFLEGTAPLDLKSQRPTMWTGLRFSF